MRIHNRMQTTAVVLLLCCLGIPSIGHTAESPEDITTQEQANAMTDAAYKLMQEEAYEEAAAGFREAKAAWQVVIDQLSKKDQPQKESDDAKQAQKRHSFCHNNLVWCVDKPIHQAMDDADSIAKEGEVEKGSELLLQVAQRYADAYARTEDRLFKTNQTYCLVQSGLVLIRHADKLVEKEEFGEAVRLYSLSIDRYKTVHERLGTQQYENNVKYATQNLKKARFAHLIASRAKAFEFDLESMSGGQVRLSEFSDRPVLLVFWAGWCGSCRKNLPVIDELYRQHRDEGIAVVGLCVERAESWKRSNSAEKSSKWATENITFPTAWADEGVLAAYGAPSSVPTMIWLDTQGRVSKLVTEDDRTPEKLKKDFKALVSGETL